jgi:hypothetical protein
MYHGIIIDKEFNDPNLYQSFKVFNQKRSGKWKIYGIEIDDSILKDTITKIQENMKKDEPWYAHLYNGKDLIIIFKERVFYIKSDKSTWVPALELGKQLKIPEKQLDFHPNKFEDENNYFS